MPYTIPIFKCRLVRDGNIKMENREIACEEHCAAVFMKTLADLPHEEMHAIFLDARTKIVGFQVIAIGGGSGIGIMTSDVFRGAVAANARAIVIAHNHPSGDPAPSSEDLAMTVSVRKAGEVLGIHLLDHIVCAPATGLWRSIMAVSAIHDAL